MNTIYLPSLALLMCCLFLGNMDAQAQSRVDYDYAYIGDPLPDPLMQQNKETYVLYGCAYCHGIDLVPVGEAADLRYSPLVAADTDANVIGPILRNGIPQTPKSSPMPQFSDLSEREIKGISAFIHYARAEERYKELTMAPAMEGDAEAGGTYFEQNCGSCHAVDAGLSGLGARNGEAALRQLILKPTRFRTPASRILENRENEAVSEARMKHQVLLENYEKDDVANLVAYLKALD